MSADHTRAYSWLVTILVAWFGAALAMGALGLFDQTGRPPVLFGLFIGVPVAGFLIGYWLSKTLREALLALPLWLVVAAHGFRFVGIFFVVGALTGGLAPPFGMPAGMGDIVAAIGSVPLLMLLRQGRRSTQPRRWFVAWNVFGLVDLLCALTLGLLYSNSTFGILSQPGLDSQALVHLPLSLIPTFYVPMLLLLHLLALRRYREL